jgi:DNA-binding response OmpR family regulator
MAQQTIMIIDDDQDVLTIIRRVLEHEDYIVKTGYDVTDLYEIEKTPPDLLLIDNWLNGKTGHDICYHLKTTPKTSKIPVLLISATTNLAQTAQSCKADGFITKPFNLEELLLKVRIAIGKN